MCRASHFIELPCHTSLCPVFVFFVSLFSAAQHLTLTVVCDSSFIRCIRVLLLYVAKITHIYFNFFIKAR